MPSSDTSPRAGRFDPRARLPTDLIAVRSSSVDGVHDPQRPYYDSWGRALESMVLDLDLTTPAALDAATPTERAPL
jgi:hypothetical protein